VRRRLYTGLVARVFHLELSEDELKMTIAALRQVSYTFQVAQRQGGPDAVAEEYQHVEDLYEELHDRLEKMLHPPGSSPLERVK
jgi:hypothetical protein